MSMPVDRSKFLGASDAAAVMGLSPWTTPVELWLEKTGRKPPERVPAIRQRMFDRGHKLEPIIVEMAVDKLTLMGFDVELVACNKRYADPDFPFLSCEIDFELRLSGTVYIGETEHVFSNELVNADAKSVTGFARKKWGLEENTEDVPIEYAAQFMDGLMITPGHRRYCLVAALRSFDDVDIYWTLRDDETIAAMRAKMVKFWLEHVVADVPPDPTVFTDVKALFPLDNGLAIEATDDIAQKVELLRHARGQHADLTEVIDQLCFTIGDYISPMSRLTYKGRDIATWKGQSDRRIEVDRLKEEQPDIASAYTRTKIIRVLRLPKPKP